MTDKIPYYVLLNDEALEVTAHFPDKPEGQVSADLMMVADSTLVRFMAEGESGSRIFLVDVEGASKQRLTHPLPPSCYKICACCGAVTKGRQWSNQDDGRGLCTDCIGFTARNGTPKMHSGVYGLRGIHFDVFALTDTPKGMSNG